MGSRGKRKMKAQGHQGALVRHYYYLIQVIGIYSNIARVDIRSRYKTETCAVLNVEM